MSRILMMTTGEKGHTNPMIGVAQWLRRDGHDVGWLCIPEPTPQLRALDGIELVALDGMAAADGELVTGGAELARLVRDAGALRGWIKTLLLDAVPAQIAPVRAAMRRFRPDAVALDPMLYQGVIAAHLEGLPYAGVSSSLNPIAPALGTELMRTIDALAPQRRALFADHGLAPEFRVCDCLSPTVNTVFATAALLGEVDLPPRTHLVGPSLAPDRRGDETDFPWARLAAGRPVVYASFGSQISWQPDVFTRLAEAVAPLDATLVITAGELVDLGFGAELPGDVVIARYVPQLALLARAHALVTHGGANSVMEALHAGVPMLVSAVCNDQPVQAHFVARSGAGLALDLQAASVDDARTAVAALLRDEGIRGRAARLAASYRAADGAREAARLVAGMCSG